MKRDRRRNKSLMKCEMCASGEGVTVPYGAGPYTWLHHDCWERWRAAGYPSLYRSSDPNRPVDPEVEAHCRLAFASWDSLMEPDKDHWRAKFESFVTRRQQAA
jgi:hypothetical protein